MELLERHGNALPLHAFPVSSSCIDAEMGNTVSSPPKAIQKRLLYCFVNVFVAAMLKLNSVRNTDPPGSDPVLQALMPGHEDQHFT